MTAKWIGCPCDTHDVDGCGLFATSEELDAHLAATHGTTYDLATGSTLSQDECDALGLDGRDGTGEYTLSNMPGALRGPLWALRGGTLRTVRFSFDDSPTFDGLTDDTRWNGFLNVKVTPAVRDAIVAEFEAQWRAYGTSDAREDYVGGIDTIPVEGGLVDLGGGFATQETED